MFYRNSIMDLAIQKRRYIADNDTEVNDNKIKCAKKSKVKIDLIAINDDCLEKLFLYLHLKDLANISVSDTRFSNCAGYVFRTLYANTLIVFDPCTSNRKNFNDFLNILDGLGNSIRRLQVTFYHEQRYRNRNQEILKRIMEKCSKSVVELNLSNIPNDMNISKPFSNLQKFTLNDSYFNGSMAHFIRISPNITSLEFYGIENVFNSSFIEQKVPLMKHFGNYNQVITDSEVENLKNFRRFLNVNEQLTSLGIGQKELEIMFQYEEIRRQFFKTIHRKFPYPEEENLILNLLPFESIYFGQLKQLSLSLGYSTDFLLCMRQRQMSISQMPLEQLELFVGHFNIESIDLVILFRQLRMLHLNVCERLNIIRLMGAALELKKLVELKVFLLYNENPTYSVIPDVTKEIIKNCGHLKRIVIGFKIEKPSHSIDLNYEKETARQYEAIYYESFSKVLPHQWSIHFETQNIEIKRQNSNKSFVLCAILDQHS